ncbi:MAG: hypothetical protein SPF18_07245 [Blautia sp.]|nr:hypothetical protein [Blautia sp.]
MIFQNPMAVLNPTLTIKTQRMETIMLHQNCCRILSQLKKTL